MVRINTNVSLAILGRESSAPLCFSKMTWMEIVILKSREVSPNMDVAKGKSQRESMAQNRRRMENKGRYFFIM